MSSIFHQLLGPTLWSRDGSSVSTHTALQHKRVIGLFFMASVCENCRVFTPTLATVYRNMQLKMYQDLTMRHELEIIVISLDANAVAFRDVLRQTPFLAMPLHKRARAHALLQRYNVQRIPSVVFVDNEARVLHANGRALVHDNYTNLRTIWMALSTSHDCVPRTP